MAEFCLKCFNKMNGLEYTEKEVIMSDDEGLCEGCAEWKEVVISIR